MAKDGGVVEGYDEAPVVEHMKGREIDVEVDLNLGRGEATVWTCDLTHGYIDMTLPWRHEFAPLWRGREGRRWMGLG